MLATGAWCPLKTYRSVNTHDTSAQTWYYYLYYTIVSGTTALGQGNAPQLVMVYNYVPAVYSNEKPSWTSNNATKGVFVVFDLKPEISMSNGDGSEENPYELVINTND